MATESPIIRSDFYVYALFRESGSVFYIGKGRGRRWSEHLSEARRGHKSHKSRIIRDMQARRVEVIKIKLHDGLTEAAAHEYEVVLIKAIGRGIHGPLANVTDGGEGVTGFFGRRGKKHTPEAIARMSAAQLGKEHTPESRAKLKAAAARHGKKPSPECIMAATAAKLGKKHSPERVAKHAATQRGRKHSEEHCAKIGAANLGKKRSPEQCENIGAARRGKNLSAHHRASLSAVRRGKKWSPEAKAKGMATRAATKLAKAAVLAKQDSRQMTFSGLLPP